MNDLFNQPPRHLRNFSGAEYVPALDQKRLTKQIDLIYDLMKDGKYRTLAEISQATGAHEASVSAQLRNLKKIEFGYHGLEKRRRGEPGNGLWEYRILRNEKSTTREE